MRINEHTAVSTTKVLLVPYSAHHVPKYHEWMKDPDIQEATASEPLSLEEEYAMQRSWRADADKMTFIICLPASDHQLGTPAIRDAALDIPSMIGDVNLFISTAEDEEGASSQVVAELELMIAERSEHRKGYGRGALLAFLAYIIRHEMDVLREFNAGQDSAVGSPSQFDHLAVKIGQTNHGSIALFEGLGFRKTSEEPSYFGEYELRLSRAAVHALVTSNGSGTPSLDGYMEVEYLYRAGNVDMDT
ncbi:DNA polymerase delta subunit 2 [Exophiala viscosa]|uniref:DNA polymerase delta subunit 2 n=1 Tax=Exophiala viscosa TaxID=2486360 RepID=A0AAN6DXZ9_9EURO|nr:DNA polymerase delta subunit 2 [Exophiala viscosa]KAI1621620.1 DNA polymerase delta subunit 2 [Exophiala viscosa]